MALSAKGRRDKGARVERDIVNKHRANLIPSERVPLSGGAHYKGEGHDIDIYWRGEDEAPLIAEVKCKNGTHKPTTLLSELAENDLLFVKTNGEDPYVFMPWRTYIRLIRGASWRS